MNERARLATAVDALPVLTRQGDTRPRWRPGERLNHLFEAVAAQHARRTAVEWSGGEMSFAALEAAANRLARLLLDRGLGSGDVIALLFDRSVESYVALLATLKINAAYVPLDPVFPPERVRYIAGDAGARAVLTVSEYAGLAAAAEVEVLSLDALAEVLRGYSGDRVAAPQAEGELAYIIYTSGSTGRPKGVPIEHASIVHFVRVAAETYGYRLGDRVYQGLTLAFDFSVEEILVPLLVGATLVPSQSGIRLVGEDLHAFLAEKRITALCCVPTLLATITEELPELRLLIVSGEACQEEIVRRWHRACRTILNAYGPTEATVTATVAVLGPDEPVTTGEPLPGYMIVVLDPEAPRALGPGELGEIGIAGIGLSPGYLGRDDLTARAFVPDFLGLPDNPSGRIYRTGDVGRIDASGRLECLGRIDTQVKIRGYRIDLGEIESVIMQRPGVVQAVVDKFEPEPGTTELVAYYTSSCHVSPQELAEALRAMLPSYMVPAYYEPLTSIAMLPCDKVDRKGLPRPSGLRLVRSGRDYVAPEGEIETRLAALLAELLHIERVSVADDFFDDLGTNSLMMARFSTRIRAAFQTDKVSMREIYQAPTIRSLATHIGTARAVSPPDPPAEAPHIASDLAYWGTGAYQLLVVLVVLWGTIELWFEGVGWVLAAEGFGRYLNAAAFSAANIALFTALPVAAKWLLIGRWREGAFPVWSLRYALFWTVKTLMRGSPLAAAPGTPLYNAYLRMLGAKVAWSAIVQCRLPVCTDLFEVGDGAVVGREVYAQCYHAAAGRIVCGRVRVGSGAYVGEGAVLDIDTVMEDGSELAHASSLHPGQVAVAGASYHGTPAIRTDTRFRRLAPGRVSPARRIGFSLAQLGAWIFIYGPIPLLLLAVVASASGEGAHLPDDTLSALPSLLGFSGIFFLGTIVLGLVAVVTLPRLAWAFLEADRVYPLFGLRHLLFQTVVGTSNSTFYNLMFGDSSYILHYLRALGYRFPEMRQTGSNFGVSQRQDIPFLCEFGSGSMVSDGLVIFNAEFSNASFRLGHMRFGRDTFLGNELVYPAGGRVGDNVLVGTKALIPTDGPLREDTGLLGSPAFEIPRTVQRDRQFDHLKTPEILAERLRLKDRYNLATIGIFLATRFGLLALVVVVGHAHFFEASIDVPFGLAVSTLMIMFLSFAYVAFVERASLGFRPLTPRYCSIYDRYYWLHERFWKLSVTAPLAMLAGTPLKGLMWRALGVRVGRKLYDEGCGIPERTLVTVGDHATLNAESLIQAHSLEDGTFKSDRIVIGAGTTLGIKALVHYGTVLGDGCTATTDSFVMKGEQPAPNSRWGGNPARPIYGAENVGAVPEAQRGPKATAIR